MGPVTVEGGTRQPRMVQDDGKWSELRTHPEGWSTTKPQLHEGRGGRPLVFLIPWAGATPKQLANIVYFWQDQGCAVLRVSPSYWQLFHVSKANDTEIDIFYQYLRTHVMPNRGFLVHSMSSLGSYTLGRLMDLDKTSGRDLFSFCKGVMFDSGPLLVSPDQVRKQGRLNIGWLSESAGVLTAASKGEPLGPLVDLFWTPVFLLVLIYLGLFQFNARLSKAECVYNRLTEGMKGIRVMVLYSEYDEYASPHDVLHYKELIARTTKVKAVLTETAHCCHLADAPDIARGALRDFLAKCEDDQ